MRRALPVVALAAVLVLAGCLSTVGPASPDPETPDPESPDGTDTPTPYPTPSAGCDAAPQETVDPYRDDVEPSQLPSSPDELDRESVERYVVDFEEAFARNQALSADSTQVNTMVVVENLTERNGTWVVDVVSRTNTWAQGTDTAAGTPTVIHGDGPRIPVRYHLTDEGLYRLELGYDETPVAGEYGTAVTCFD